MKSKKGQITLNDLPMAILIIALVFILMATFAYVSSQYGESFSLDRIEISNETLTAVTQDGAQVASAGACNFQSFSVSIATNASGGEVIQPGNYSVDPTGGVVRLVTNSSGGTVDIAYNNSNWNVSYTYQMSGMGCNITGSLEQEIGDNTSIAGLLFTLTIVGVILGVLILLFAGAFARRV